MSSNFTQPILSEKKIPAQETKRQRSVIILKAPFKKNVSTALKVYCLLLFVALGKTATAQLNLKFTSYTLKTATSTDGMVGAKYLFTKVNDTLDCIVTIKEISGNATLTILDNNSTKLGGNANRFQPIISVPASKATNKTSYIRFNFQLIKTGSFVSTASPGTNVVPSDPLWFRAYDIDGNGVANNDGVREFVELSSVFTGTWVDVSSQLVTKSPVATGETAYTINNSSVNGTSLSDDPTLAFNGFIYANTVGSWDIVGGATVGGTQPAVNNDPDPNQIGDGDRINSWSFSYTDVVPGIDFGDAPASYNVPVGAAANATIIPAYHIVPSDASKVTVFLGGAKPDIDYDPSGNLNATVDDNNAATDDEDGFQSTYFPKYTGGKTYTCTISATNTSGSSAYLYGYIDFNGDGKFDPTYEISNQIIVPSKAGLQYFTVTFSKAFTYVATSKSRYARFRISSADAEASAPTGRAANGEVEDYRFNTALQITGTVYDDANGNVDNLINGTGKAAMATTTAPVTTYPLYAVLLDSVGKVLQSAPLGSNGTYTLDSAGTNGKFTVAISTINPLFKATPTLAGLNTLPTGFIYTSEGITSSMAAGDQLAAGNFLTTTTTADVTKMDFGWDALPETDSKSISINSPSINTKYPLTAALTGSDPEDSKTASSISTGGTFIIKTLPSGATLYYDGAAVTAGKKITAYDPNKLTIQFATASATKSFTYQTVDAAGMPDPTPATYTINSNSVLPLNDIVLSANLQNGVVKLILVAKDENQTARYTWEQSTDGINFTVVGSSAYQPAGASANTYTFSTVPTGSSSIVYFRSVQYSVDGKILVSNTVAVKMNETATGQVLAMPTIIKDVTNIKITSAINQTISLTIVDNAGRLVLKKQAVLYTGNNTFAIDGFEKLTNGSYYIQVVGVDAPSILKVVVQH